ncbi:putative basic amino acid antiporter YfcC [Parahaliea aestuarii]|uniref:putative basic amino acid antiporter YfcC n=1 Tax=Parahaliea aestuarii TaxID=1852021 RepID=UPI001FE54020|nr:putative basic amino acid antiporter YfcC [Parahaliea aestuarii]
MSTEVPAVAAGGAQRWLPDTYLILAGIALLVFGLGFVVEPGVFLLVEGAADAAPRVDPDSFRTVAGQPLALFAADGQRGLFNALYEGLVSGSRSGGAVGIMAFILLTGGAFGIVTATGAVDRGIGAMTGLARGDGRILLAVLFLMFSLSGAVFGMGEEVAPFVLVLMPVLQRLGYSASTVVMVTYLATQVGFATSWMNPFSLAIAQGIAGLPLLSGLSLRLVMWAVFTLLSLVWVLRLARRERRAVVPEAGVSAPLPGLGWGDRLVLLALAATLAWLIWGVARAGYYLPEIATQFVVLGAVAAVLGVVFGLNGMSGNSAMAAFRRGASDLLPAALVVGFARGIVYLMGGDDPQQPSLLNTLLFHATQALDGLPATAAAWLMLLGQSVFNFFVSSGSGQAALTMPLMAPLGDLVGVSRQVSVLAFQLGDGLSNLVVPTSAGLMASLGAARLDWALWLRASAGLFLGLWLLASVFVVVAVLIGYQ